ncbi:MAG TPA: tyrosine-type recombinase/integrase [Vicinamibacterales bacterium]|nr:tyrosine-type recombinase/integrase [Vicinamibacterales bacterium]
MKDGTIRNRNRRPFKPSAIRSYEQSLRNYLRPEFGSVRLCDLTRNDIQDFVDALLAQGLDPSTVRNSIMPLRVIYRRAVRRGVVMVNPMTDLELPAVTGRRDRVASPAEAEALLAVLPEDDRAVWATAMYAGLRRGELWALQADRVDLQARLIHVERSWDRYEGNIDLKSEAGRRIVPICDHLRAYLDKGSGFYFGSEAGPFNYDALIARAKKAWADAGLRPITLHECRHSFSTFLDAAGVSETRADIYMGHANHSVSRRYRHPSQYAEDSARLDEYLSGVEAGKVVSLEERAA